MQSKINIELTDNFWTSFQDGGTRPEIPTDRIHSQSKNATAILSEILH